MRLWDLSETRALWYRSSNRVLVERAVAPVDSVRVTGSDAETQVPLGDIQERPHHPSNDWLNVRAEYVTLFDRDVSANMQYKQIVSLGISISIL